MKGKVLVTGASGFVASHCVIRLLERGYHVRGTVRTPSRIESLRTIYHKNATFDDALLEFCQADLNEDEGWADAVAGCDYVLHVASPSAAVQPKEESVFITPAVEGTLKILGAAADAGIKKVVMTSSTVAIGKFDREVSTEDDWADSGRQSATPYQKSKIFAERAAWDFIAKSPSGMKLSTICPSLVLGPCLEEDFGVSLTVICRLLDGSIPLVPRVGFPVVDARDVAELHILAMESPEADGERFIASNGTFTTLQEMSRILNEGLPRCKKSPAPTRKLPTLLMRVVGMFDREIRSIIPNVDREEKFSPAKAEEKLGWSHRSDKEAIVSSGQSLVDLGIV